MTMEDLKSPDLTIDHEKSIAAPLSDPILPNTGHLGVDCVDCSRTLPITYRYLTFETTLPIPNPISIKRPSDTLLETPDLRNLEDPKSWHWVRKATAVGTSSFGCCMVAYASASYAFAVSDISREFHVSTIAANAGITIFNIGFAFTPMLCAPLSETIGRYPIFVISGILFVITQLCCTLTPSFAGLLVCRFLVGCGGSTFSTIVGGVVSDIFAAQDRNVPMAVFSSTTMLGVGIGLSISGALVQHNSWRWIFGVQTILSGLALILVIIFLKETRSNVILRRRARELNKWYEKLECEGFFGVEIEDRTRNGAEYHGEVMKERYEIIRWKVEADDQRPGILSLIGISVTRPFHMLATEPVVFFFSLWAMFAWSILYLTFESVPLIMTVTYGFTDYQNGLVFVVMIIATSMALPACIIQEKYQRRNGKSMLRDTPEGRLTFVCFLSCFLPIGLFWFGWTSKESIFWVVPVVGIGFLTIGIFTIYLAVFNYFADVYGIYASSAMAAQSFCRNVTSSVFPLFSNMVFFSLGFGPTSSILGGVGILLMLAPVLLLINGPKIRARSSYINT